MSTDPQTPASDASLGELVGYFHETLRHLGTGDLANLRRASIHSGYVSATLYKILNQSASHQHHPLLQPYHERQWGELLSHMAHDTEQRPQGERRSLGSAMAEADVSELRLTRLLNAPARDEQGGREGRIPLHEELGRTLGILRSKGVLVRWSDVAQLIFSSSEQAEKLRRRIARDYYNHLHHNS